MRWKTIEFCCDGSQAFRIVIVYPHNIHFVRAKAWKREIEIGKIGVSPKAAKGCVLVRIPYIAQKYVNLLNA